MKKVLKNGKISKLISDSGYEGWSKEVHLLKYKGKKFILRKCKTLKIAKNYEEISRKFEKYGFLPKLLCRIKKDILYEYISGRDLRKKESNATIYQIGKMAGYVNRFKDKGKAEKEFNNYLNGATTGKFKGAKQKPIITKEEGRKIKKIFNYLNKRVKPRVYLDMYDIYPDNFRIRKGKVYLVDLGAIDSRIKGLGISKAFLKWFKTEETKKAFKRGYNSVNSFKFFNGEYEDLSNLNFIIREMYHKCRIGQDYDKNQFDWLVESYKKRRKELNGLLEKYGFLY